MLIHEQPYKAADESKEHLQQERFGIDATAFCFALPCKKCLKEDDLCMSSMRVSWQVAWLVMMDEGVYK